MQNATIHPPTTGMTELKPAATAAVLVRPDCQTPVSRIVIALMRRGHERDDEHLHDGVQPLLRRLVALRGAVGDGGGAVAGFVRVDAARDAVAHRDEHAEAERRVRRERLAHDQREDTAGIRPALIRMTIRPPTRYRPTLSGDSFSAARPIDLMPPMITSHVSTAMAMPDTIRGIPSTRVSTSAMELGCVNGVVVSAATAATSANSQARNGRAQAVAQVVHRP